MKVVKAKNVKVEKSSGGIFIGTVEIASLVDSATGSKEFKAAIVTFPPGTKNRFHTHDGEQILYILNGKGIVATKDEERAVTVGDTVLIPAGELHWHGATTDSVFSHLYITKAGTKTSF